MLTYFTKEEKGQETLLFLHGWGCEGKIFQPIAEKLNCDSFLIDLWGFGKSQSPPPEGFSVEDYADNLKEFCLSENLKNFSIVAHSFGGRVALVFCAKYPEFCEKLVITGGAGLKRFSLKRFLKIRKYKICKWLVKRKLLKPSALAKFGSTDFKAAESPALKHTFLKAVNEDLSQYAKKVKCKTLLVWGKSDDAAPLWIARKLKKLIEDSFLIEVDGGHFVFLENPERFSGIVEAYLKGV